MKISFDDIVVNVKNVEVQEKIKDYILGLRENGVKHNTKWSNDEVQNLINFTREGLKPREIAPKLGRKVTGVSAKLVELRKEGLVEKPNRKEEMVIN